MFQADDNIREIAEAYSLDAVDHANNAGVHLDWTDNSIEKVEEILGLLHQEMGHAKPSEDQVLTFATMYGSYVGEVFRKRRIDTGEKWTAYKMRAFRSTGLDAITVAELVPKGSRRRQFKRQAVARGLMTLVESADASGSRLKISGASILRPWRRVKGRPESSQQTRIAPLIRSHHSGVPGDA